MLNGKIDHTYGNRKACEAHTHHVAERKACIGRTYMELKNVQLHVIIYDYISTASLKA